MAKKKSARLPRLTVLSMSKRDLVAFVQSVETLRLLVDELRLLLAAKKIKPPAGGNVVGVATATPPGKPRAHDAPPGSQRPDKP